MAIEPLKAAFKDRIAKASERNSNQAAARYLRMRSLIEEADEVINGAEIPKHSAKKFGAKLLKARRMLDRGLENQVSLILEEVIDEIRNNIKETKNGITVVKNEIKARFTEVCNPHSPNHISRPCTRQTEVKKQPKFIYNADSRSPQRTAPISFSVTHAGSGVDKTQTRSYSATNRRSSPSRKRGDANDENDIEEEVEVNTLNTLQLALHILQELPRASFTDHELSETEDVLKMTKPLLMSHEGCQKLRPFLETLKTCLALAPHRRQPELSMALQGIRIVSYEVTSQPRKRNLKGILKN